MTRKELLHNGKTHKPGFNPSCPECKSKVTRFDLLAVNDWFRFENNPDQLCRKIDNWHFVVGVKQGSQFVYDIRPEGGLSTAVLSGKP